MKICIALEEITLFSAINMIESSSFINCTAVRIVNLNVTGEIFDTLKSQINSFTALEEINVINKNSYYTSIDGVLYTADMTTVVLSPSGKE